MKKKQYVFFIIIITINIFISKGDCTCYFPIEYQDTFLIQAQATPTKDGSEVTYSEITLEVDAIPPWGRCHKRRGHNVILKDSNGIEDCMRCFHLTFKTPNVIQLYTEDLSKCYTNEDAARATCPSEKDIRERKFKEFMLFRKHVSDELMALQHTFCPINGRYRFTYLANNGLSRCDQSYSNLSNCPQGNALRVKFRQCAFANKDIDFLCLGDWESQNGDRYLALMDLAEKPKSRSKYRCGLYREDSASGKIYLSLSSDSTCITHLKSATNGFESLILTPLMNPKLMSVQPEKDKCRFPEWTQGKWDRVKIDGNLFKFKDTSNHFRTLTSKCIIRQTDTQNDRFIIHSTNQCGDSFYGCVWMKRRSPNILEFQLGSKTSDTYSGDLCNDIQFTTHEWVTQGRKNIAIPTPCPITGDYTGVVPGISDICAKIASDCNNPDIMFYTVSSCENRSHIYEEREYRCLGNWEEDDVLYTYTQRRDMAGFQCFTGKILGNGESAYLKEAGDSCIRGEDPFISGMKINKQASCPRLHYLPQFPLRSNWPTKFENVIPHKPLSTRNQPPSIKSFAFQPISPAIIPIPRTAATKDPHWYQADVPSSKIWLPRTIRPYTLPELRRNSGSDFKPVTSLIISLSVLTFFLS